MTTSDGIALAAFLIALGSFYYSRKAIKFAKTKSVLEMRTKAHDRVLNALSLIYKLKFLINKAQGLSSDSEKEKNKGRLDWALKTEDLLHVIQEKMDSFEQIDPLRFERIIPDIDGIIPKVETEIRGVEEFIDKKLARKKKRKERQEEMRKTRP